MIGSHLPSNSSAGSQARFNADHDIYGDFAEKAAEADEAGGATHRATRLEDQMLDPTDDA